MQKLILLFNEEKRKKKKYPFPYKIDKNYTRYIFSIIHEQNFQDFTLSKHHHVISLITILNKKILQIEAIRINQIRNDDRDVEIIRKMAQAVLKFATTLSLSRLSDAANHPSGKKLFIRLFPIFVMAALYRYLSFILNHVTTRAAVFWWTSGACPAFLQRIPPKREISWPDQFFINERPRVAGNFHATSGKFDPSPRPFFFITEPEYDARPFLLAR